MKKSEVYNEWGIDTPKIDAKLWVVWQLSSYQFEAIPPFVISWSSGSVEKNISFTPLLVQIKATDWSLINSEVSISWDELWVKQRTGFKYTYDERWYLPATDDFSIEPSHWTWVVSIADWKLTLNWSGNYGADITIIITLIW